MSQTFEEIQTVIIKELKAIEPSTDSWADRTPNWARLAAAKIALIAGDSPIVFIDHDFEIREPSEPKTVVAFTDDVLILLTFGSESTCAPSPSTHPCE
ncbi:hypothetical protein [Cryobacterium sp. TMT4-31]|uniref:hypothetical protein n=1 Tax=Cryobacterium sp. TMT4-31 TaxID=1259259 RepID=UPI00106CC95D|nr:hypothetical protein [Cryobacterium sp. TMT4-31]TFC84861.1 hypothetical protein E3T19_18005 [Cryobacterium sp. TMT4-31]